VLKFLLMRAFLTISLTVPSLHSFQGQYYGGSVVDALTGKPVADVRVKWHGGDSVVSSRVGHFQITLILPAGFLATAQAFEFTASGYVTKWQTLSVEQSARVELTPQAFVSGTVDAEKGRLVEGEMVEAFRYKVTDGERYFELVYSKQTDKSGHYRMPLTAGFYYILASATSITRIRDAQSTARYYPNGLHPGETERIELRAGEERTDVDFHLTKYEGPTVSGRFELSGGRIPQEAWLVTPGTHIDTIFSGVSPVDGTFSFPHVPPGQYRILARYDGELRHGDCGFERPVEVHKSDVTGVLVGCRRIEPVDITGSLVFEGAARPEPMQIRLHQRPLGRTMGLDISTFSNPDGSFVLPHVLPGRYDLIVTPPPGPGGSPRAAKSQAAYARLGSQDILLPRFDFQAPPSGELRVWMSAISGNIDVTVLDSAGRVVAGAIVILQPTRITETRFSFTGDDGIARIVAFPGEYRVYVARDGSRDDMGNPDWLKAHENDFPRAQFVEGTNSSMALVLRQ
jgi:hypothetical protein